MKSLTNTAGKSIFLGVSGRVPEIHLTTSIFLSRERQLQYLLKSEENFIMKGEEKKRKGRSGKSRERKE